MEQSLQVMSKQERLENWTTRIMACRSSGTEDFKAVYMNAKRNHTIHFSF